MFSNFFLILTIYEIICKDIKEPERPQMTIWHLNFMFC